MAILNRGSGSLFPLISDIKNSNSKNEASEPALKRSVGSKSDVRVGDGMTVILSKIWGALKKQEDFTKVAKKNIEADKKFKKESKDLMRKNHQVILNSLNVLNKDVTKVLSKILDVGQKSAKEESKRLEENERIDEIKQDFAKETFRETESDAERRHKELLKALGNIVGDGEGKTKRQKKSPFEKLLGDLKKDFLGLFEGSLSKVFGRSLAKFLTATVPSLIASAVTSSLRLVLAHPLVALGVAITGLTAWLGSKYGDMLSDLEKGKNTAAAKGDVKEVERKSEQLNNMYAALNPMGPGLVDTSKAKKDTAIALEKANTPESRAALEKLYTENPDLRPQVKSNVNTGKVQKASPESTQLTLPVNQGTFTSDKGSRTLNGVTKEHNGVDIALPENSPVLAAAGGTVSTGYNQQSGNYIRVMHNDGSGLISSYAHLNGFNVKNGAKVVAGQQIGLSGGAKDKGGHTTGPHLHFALKRMADNKWLDPKDYIPELRGAEKSAEVKTGSAPSAVRVAGSSEAGSQSAGVMDDALAKAQESSMFPDVNSLIAAALSGAESLVKGTASMFQDTGIKTSSVDKLDKLRADLVSDNKQPAINNFVNNTIASGGSGSDKSGGQTMSARSRDSTKSLAEYAMFRPVTGWTA
jgi:murein DD-endopeptidase MepM/ murein hydrolase activator NlpD